MLFLRVLLPVVRQVYTILGWMAQLPGPSPKLNLHASKDDQVDASQTFITHRDPFHPIVARGIKGVVSKPWRRSLWERWMQRRLPPLPAHSRPAASWNDMTPTHGRANYTEIVLGLHFYKLSRRDVTSCLWTETKVAGLSSLASLKPAPRIPCLPRSSVVCDRLSTLTAGHTEKHQH